VRAVQPDGMADAAGGMRAVPRWWQPAWLADLRIPSLYCMPSRGAGAFGAYSAIDVGEEPAHDWPARLPLPIRLLRPRRAGADSVAWRPNRIFYESRLAIDPRDAACAPVSRGWLLPGKGLRHAPNRVGLDASHTFAAFFKNRALRDVSD